MKIFCSELFQKQLLEYLEKFANEDLVATKKFKTYLDTIVINMPTKAKKYKKSIFFDDENIRDIEHESFRIPFLIDEPSNSYLLLGIYEKSLF